MLHIITERKTFILDMNILDRNTGKMVLLSAVLLLFFCKKTISFQTRQPQTGCVLHHALGHEYKSL